MLVESFSHYCPRKNITLQEPSFKEVVVLYRSKRNLKSTSSSSKSSPSKMSSEDRMKDILDRRNLHLRCFRDIPMADLNLVFPDKKVINK